MQLSQILDNLMREKSISAYKISKDTGISDRLIGYWRNGDKLPSAENLLTIANYFGISVDYLLTGKESSANENQLDEIETKLISDFRSLSPQGQDYIRQQMFMAREVYKKEQDLPQSNINVG